MAEEQDRFAFVDDGKQSAYQELREELLDGINEFADRNDVNPGLLALLLVDLGVTARMLEYLFTTEKPSVAGLKFDLDRFHREICDFIRSSKKVAPRFVSESKSILDAAEADETTGEPRVA
jgi:hypothetical protein